MDISAMAISKVRTVYIVDDSGRKPHMYFMPSVAAAIANLERIEDDSLQFAAIVFEDGTQRNYSPSKAVELLKDAQVKGLDY